MDIQELVRFYA